MSPLNGSKRLAIPEDRELEFVIPLPKPKGVLQAIPVIHVGMTHEQVNPLDGPEPLFSLNGPAEGTKAAAGVQYEEVFTRSDGIAGSVVADG